MVNRLFFFLLLIFLKNTDVFSLENFDFSSLDHGPDFQVIVKNVGQGSCSILKNHFNGETVIVDAGSSANAPLKLEESIAEEFGEASISGDLPSFAGKITLITSHTDQDHLSLFYNIFGKNSKLISRLSYVYLGDHLANYYKSLETKSFLQGLLASLPSSSQIVYLSHALPITPAILSAEDPSLIDDTYYQGYREHIPLDGFLERGQQTERSFLEILSANAGADTEDLVDENANSAIVRLCINGKNILIMGDATGLTTRRLLLSSKNRLQLNTELLIASHHGAKDHETNNGLWLSTIKPKMVAISAGYRDVWLHPRAEFIIDLMIIDSLIAQEKDEHEVALSGAEKNSKFYTEALGSYMTFHKQHEKFSKWIVFKTKKSLHNTASSGDLSYVYNKEGQLMDFLRKK